ncbi:hypothetical protein D3C75_1070480 [compost metagenome]
MSSGSGSAFFMKLVHTCRAPVAPVNGVLPLSSRPIHTTASRSWLKPENQLSRESLLVPVLPARVRLRGKVLYTERPVPSRITRCMAFCTR